MRISERRLEVLIGASVGSTSSKSWISGYGPDYRNVKVIGHDSSVYILRLDEINDQWELIMFSTARAPSGWQSEQHDLARSAQSRQ